MNLLIDNFTYKLINAIIGENYLDCLLGDKTS